MGRYHHLGIEEREGIMRMGREHWSLADIAAAIGRDRSTASRGLSRNGRGRGAGGARDCRASTAQARYEGRRLRLEAPSDYASCATIYRAVNALSHVGCCSVR